MGNPGAMGGKQMGSLGYKPGDKILDRYEVKSELGRGSFGEVLEVVDAHDGKLYALKGLDPALAQDPKQFMELKNNFGLIKDLQNPHICQNFDLLADRKTRRAYLIMELIKGQELKDWTDKEREKLGAKDAPIPMPIVLGIAEQIAEALDYAHAFPISNPDGTQGYGVLHRDLKPANVMISTEKEYQPGVPWVKVIDFGLAAIGQAGINDMSIANVANQRMGTPLYMAPEQWTGKTLTRGVDQWSLAVIIYELAAGHRPFTAKTEMELMMTIAAAAPNMPKSLSPMQWAALKKTMQPDRKRRHRSCLALVKAMGDADPATKGKFGGMEKALPGAEETVPDNTPVTTEGETKILHKRPEDIDAEQAAKAAEAKPAEKPSTAPTAKSSSSAIVIIVILLLLAGAGITAKMMLSGGDEAKIQAEINTTIEDAGKASLSGGTVLDQAISSLEALKIKYANRPEDVKRVDTHLETLKALKGKVPKDLPVTIPGK